MPSRSIHRRLAAIALASIVLTACSGGGLSRGGGGVLPEVPQRAEVAKTQPRADFTAKTAFTVKLLVPATFRAKSLKMLFSSGKTLQFFANLTPGSNPSCSGSPTLCNLKIDLPPNNYVATFAAYSGRLIGGKPSGKRISNNLGVPVTVAARGSIGVALGGSPRAVAFIPAATSSLVGNETSGYALSKCFSYQHVSVFGLDSHGNLILGPKPPRPSLASDNTHVVVDAPVSTAPNTFGLNRASLPLPNSMTHLTARAMSSGSAASRIVTVSFNGDICGIVTEFSTGITGGPKGIAAGPDGNLWFAEDYKIGKITTNGTVTEYSSGLSTGSYNILIHAGSDGNMWFAECGADKIGKITPAGVITEYAVPHAGAAPYGVTSGPDKNVWFTESDNYGGNRIGKVTTNGSMTEYSSGIQAGAQPFGITAGPDGRLWFAESEKPAIGAITTSGTITEYSSGIYGDLVSVAAGADGNMWFTEGSANRLGKITTAGVVTEYSNGITFGAFPWGITAGPDGNMWFVELERGVAKVTPSGAITEYGNAIGSGSFGIATGPDGSIWYTEYSNKRIARVQ